MFNIFPVYQLIKVFTSQIHNRNFLSLLFDGGETRRNGIIPPGLFEWITPGFLNDNLDNSPGP